MGLVESTTNKHERAFKSNAQNVHLTAPLENLRNRTLSVHRDSTFKQKTRNLRVKHTTPIDITLRPSSGIYLDPDLDDEPCSEAVKYHLTLDTFIEPELLKTDNNMGKWLFVEDQPERICQLM
jgi:hypothetical protein